ncbi:MAG TPA: NAD(P)/FAD-dependent oxidoreductase [Nitrososphaeraceae archaeon]|nr:NAD(P)/FAD-dependent oxidoreductase [Nitrososphaeraceae archaeon]
MSQEQDYDIVVIGSGPGGRSVSMRSVKNAFSVALVESELVGGDCAYWACMPSKALLRPPEALEEARHVEGARQAVAGNLAVESVLARRDTFVNNWDDAKESKSLADKGVVHIFHGHGRLDGPKRVEVTSPSDDNKTVFTARHAVVLATGSSPAIPADVPGLLEAKPWTSRDATSAKKVPGRLAIMGDGPVACEMADVWSALGSKVTILSINERILDRYEPFVGEQLAAAFAKRGIDVRTKVRITRVKRNNPKGPVEIELDDGTTIDADELLVAVGRKPNTGDIGLETVGIKPAQWLDVDDTFLVQGLGRDGKNDWLYALGDINHRALLTHIGKYQGRVCANAILARANGRSGMNKNDDVDGQAEEWSKSVAKADQHMVPQVIFTDPQVASVGLTEREAKDLRLKVRSFDSEIGEVDGAQLKEEGYVGHARLVIDEDKQVIVGATFLGPELSDLLHSATVAIVGQVPIDRLWHAVPSFPTVSEVWTQLLEDGFYPYT